MARLNDWTIHGAAGQPIFGTTHLPPPLVTPQGVLVICHGFKGYKDYGFFPYLAEQASARGLIAHRFNFSHSGMTPRLETFERPDLFELDTWGKQIHDLAQVLAAMDQCILAGGGLGQVWFGHSRGAVTVLLTAARAFAGQPLPGGDPAPMPPQAMVAAASPDSACGLDPEARDTLRRQGYLESPSSRTGQVLRIGRCWLDEIERDPGAFDLSAALREMRRPILLIHGQKDSTVPVDCAHRLAGAAPDKSRLEIIDDASHTFDCPNPLTEGVAPPPQTARMVAIAVSFAAENVGSV